ncbi:MAG: hypothetical protein HY619_05000 [Thaumarchaeota archaeon]|nr:hypothetical protein [Nitrososphaerota archaeon]
MHPHLQFMAEEGKPAPDTDLKTMLEGMIGDTGNVRDEYGGFDITVVDPDRFPWHGVLKLLTESFEVWVDRREQGLAITAKPRAE